MTRLFAAVILTLTVSVAWADPPGVRERAQSLVRQLGDESFEVREKATLALLELGRDAEDALRQGLTDSDAEVRSACASVLQRVLRRDREARLQSFLKEPDDRKDHGLVGWARFGKLAGTDAAACSLFVTIQRTDGAFVEAAERDPKDALTKLTARAGSLAQALITPKMDDAAFGEAVTLLFVATDPRVAVDAPTFAALCGGMQVLGNRKALRKRWLDSPAARRLLLAFLQQRDDAASLDVALPLATAFELKEARDWAVKLATERTLPGTTRGLALLLAGRIGDRDLVPKLAPLLEDTTSVGTRSLGSVQLTAQVRDVALAALVQMSGQKAEDYGFPYLQTVPGLKSLPAPVCLGFAKPADRDAALKKWKESAPRPK